jgi:hypothetical protein
MVGSEKRANGDGFYWRAVSQLHHPVTVIFSLSDFDDTRPRISHNVRDYGAFRHVEVFEKKPRLPSPITAASARTVLFQDEGPPFGGGSLLLRAVFAFIAFALVVALLAIPKGALAETNGQIMARSCPAAYAIDEKYDRAKALDDAARFKFAHQAAGLYFDCAKRLPNSYARDLARFQYAYLLYSSAYHIDELLSRLPIVTSAMNQLASDTRFSYIRQKALNVRNLSRAEYDEVYSKVNGTPEPLPEST